MSQENQKPEGPDILETSFKREIDPAFAIKMVGRMRAGSQPRVLFTRP